MAQHARLLSVDVHGVRNLVSGRLELDADVCLFTGSNGSGKTSVLEAVWMLASGRSFRTRALRSVISYDSDELTVAGQVVRTGGGRERIGVTRRRDGSTDLRVAGERVGATSELARRLPVQLVNPESIELVVGAPAVRRRFLDWGTFHVEHDFLDVWKRFQRALAQRNALLRQVGRAGGRDEEFEFWEALFAETALRLHQQRTDYIELLVRPLQENLAKLGGNPDIRVRYQAGWDALDDEAALRLRLAEQRAGDRELGYTRGGPQRADLKLQINGRGAADALSRGQQKVLACALLLAQGQVFADQTGTRSVYLVDDLPAELDRVHRVRMGRALAALPAQVLVTAVQADLVLDGLAAERPVRMFHVEQGRIQPVAH